MRLFLLLILPLLAVTDPSGQGLVFPQSACNIKCENGGMCAFSFSNPAVHSCICLIGVYSGDRCQYKIGEDPLENVEKENEALRVPDQNRIEAERREAEARVNDQRRREYEQKIREEEERKRSQDSERQRYEEEYRRREGERQRVEEQRRQEMARREQEQRAREQHRVTEDQRRVDSQWGQEDQRRREHQMREEQRQREEEKRQEDLRKLQERRKQEEERQRQEEDKKRQEEQAREQVNTRLKVENYDSEELTDEDLEPEQPEGNTWDYKQEPTAQEESSQIEKPPAESIGQIATVLESAATKAAEEHGIDLGEEIVTEPHLDPEEEGDEVKVEEGQEEQDDETFGAVKNVLREAAEKTAEEHSIDLTAEEEKKEDHNDYWDHHPKKDDLEYETPKMVDSEEEDEIRRDQDSLNMRKTEAPETEATTDVKEYPLEEGEDGWMIVKHADSQKDEEAGASTAFTVAIVALILSLAA